MGTFKYKFIGDKVRTIHMDDRIHKDLKPIVSCDPSNMNLFYGGNLKEFSYTGMFIEELCMMVK